MNRLKILGTGILSAFFAMMVSTADAAQSARATLSEIDGAAKASQGRRHTDGQEGMRLRKGDRVTAPKGSRATIRLGSGCDYDLKDGEALTIGGADTCCALEPVGATLSRILGDTLVSQRARYIKGSEGKALKRGDRVTVMEGGKATISFDDDCNYTLEDDEVLTITDVSPCSTRAALSRIEGDAGLIREGVSNKDRKARG